MSLQKASSLLAEPPAFGCTIIYVLKFETLGLTDVDSAGSGFRYVKGHNTKAFSNQPIYKTWKTPQLLPFSGNTKLIQWLKFKA